MPYMWSSSPCVKVDGIWLGHFNSVSNMANLISPWNKPGKYPAISGFTKVKGVTLAGFQVNQCGRRDYAIGSNPLSPDATHPGYFSAVETVDVLSECLAFLAKPDAGWINPGDCVDMDCDGPKHILIVVRELLLSV